MPIAGPNIQKPTISIVGNRQDWDVYFTTVYQIAFNLSRSGPTTSRPTSSQPNRWVGMPFFDTTLGKPIWLKIASTSVWVDATGASV